MGWEKRSNADGFLRHVMSALAYKTTVIGGGYSTEIVLAGYLQVLQLVLLQEVQPDDTAEVPARGFSVPVEQNTENFFFTFFELHLGQLTSWPPKTSFSKFSPQPEHVYSKIGISNSIQDEVKYEKSRDSVLPGLNPDQIVYFLAPSPNPSGTSPDLCL